MSYISKNDEIKCFKLCSLDDRMSGICHCINRLGAIGPIGPVGTNGIRNDVYLRLKKIKYIISKIK